jgi:hypothetical protein
MAISHFTRLCAFFRRSIHQASLTFFYRNKQATFFQVLSLSLCGRSVYVSKFPFLVLGFSLSPGFYFVDSVIHHHTGDIELGLEDTDGTIEYYSISDIEITDVIGSAHSDDARARRSEHGTEIGLS